MLAQSQSRFSAPANLLTTDEPFYDFSVDNLLPRHQTLSRFKRTAQIILSITNKSNGAALFHLTGQEQTAGCQVEFALPTSPAGRAPQAELKLAAGETVSVPVQVILTARPLIALRRRRYHFTVTTTLMTGRPWSRALPGQVAIRPLIGPWIILLLAVCLGVALLFTAQSSLPLDSPAAAQLSVTGPVMPSSSTGRFVMPVYMAGNSPPDLFETNVNLPAEITYRQIFEEVAGQYGLDWRILAEIAYRESGFNPWAIGRRNEMGLMQILPLTWSEWAPQVGVFDPYDPYSNVQVAAAYLVYLNNYCLAKGYTEPYWMLIGYNWGPNNLRQLFQQQGNLEDVPELPRRYALKIIQFGPESPVRWQEQLETVVVPLVKPEP